MESRQITPVSLTVAEAIEQGYKYFTGKDYESMWTLSDAKGIEDFDKFEWYLCAKEPTILTVEPSDIYEDLAENFALNNEVADDDESFRDLIIGAVDWDEVSTMINAALKCRPVYFPTKIKLITNGK
jgi:hypothetical protein